MRGRGVIPFPSEEKEVIKLMLEKAVADSTMDSDKYEKCTILSACPVPLKINSSTS